MRRVRVVGEERVEAGLGLAPSVTTPRSGRVSPSRPAGAPSEKTGTVTTTSGWRPARELEARLPALGRERGLLGGLLDQPGRECGSDADRATMRLSGSATTMPMYP